MNTRLKIICFLFGVAYLFTLITIVREEMPFFNAGYRAGREQQKEKKEFYYSKLKPVDPSNFYPTHLINQLTGESIPASILEVMAEIDTSSIKLPLWLTIPRIISTIIAVGIFGIMIYIPIQTFRVVRSIVKNVIFDSKNIKRIQRIGYALLCFYIGNLFVDFIQIQISQKLLSLDGYTTAFDFRQNLLLFGLVILLFAEILKMALKMKEEQDLTV